MKLKLFLLLFSLIVPAQAVVQNVPQSSQTEVNITLYPQDMALIKEKRKTFLKEGSNKLLIKDVPSDILVDSFIFQMIPPSASVKVLEYNFQTSQITRNALLQHSIGEKVNILPSRLVPMPETAQLLALDGEDCVVESEGRIFVLNKNRISFSHLPYTLAPEPLITLKVDNPKEGEYVFNMGYLAKGFRWDAGYTIVLDATETHLDLNNWINIHNKSGMDIKKGHFLVAHTQNAGEHFYDIEKPISLSDNAVKNISWFSALRLTPSTSFRIFPKNKITENEEGVVIKPTVETWLSVQNDRSHGLGVPLPEGIIKVFQRNSVGALFYVGENKTPFIPVEKALSLRVGSTKAITAEMRQTDYRKLGSQVVESGYRLDLKNETKFPKQVTVFQNVTGEWSILRETHPHEEEEKRLQWTITLAAQEEVSLRYRIRMNVK
ncbi:MAG: hypothetical protein H0X26_05425 [Alphaproteobacteria bacterium]|nr:hypothetical protein [Alphaproteobacteria bacterium]